MDNIWQLAQALLDNNGLSVLLGVAVGGYFTQRQERRRREDDGREAHRQQLIDAYSEWAALVQTYHSHMESLATFARGNFRGSIPQEEHLRLSRTAGARIDWLEARLLLIDSDDTRRARVEAVGQLIESFDTAEGWTAYVRGGPTSGTENPLWNEAREALKSLRVDVREPDATPGGPVLKRAKGWLQRKRVRALPPG